MLTLKKLELGFYSQVLQIEYNDCSSKLTSSLLNRYKNQGIIKSSSVLWSHNINIVFAIIRL